MEVTIRGTTIELKDADSQVYVQCRKCQRYGAQGWAHVCTALKDGKRIEGNWYFSLATVKSILGNQKRNSLRTMGFLSTPNEWVKPAS